jgi:hypothetical protein
MLLDRPESEEGPLRVFCIFKNTLLLEKWAEIARFCPMATEKGS